MTQPQTDLAYLRSESQSGAEAALLLAPGEDP